MDTLVLPADELMQLIRSVVEAGGSHDLVVTGSSMSPTLKPGRDYVRLVSPQKRPAKPGEIILAKRMMGGYMLHRVLRINTDGTLTLNGDGQVWTEDVRSQDVIAVVEAITRAGKTISCDSVLYRTYVSIWGLTRPFRDLLVAIKKKICRKR